MICQHCKAEVIAARTLGGTKVLLDAGVQVYFVGGRADSGKAIAKPMVNAYVNHHHVCPGASRPRSSVPSSAATREGSA